MKKTMLIALLLLSFISLQNVCADDDTDAKVQTDISIVGGILGSVSKNKDNKQNGKEHSGPETKSQSENQLKTQEEVDLKNFWDKEQPILDQKIKEGKILKIKGLYLGMNIDNAYKTIPDQLKTDLALEEFIRGVISDLFGVKLVIRADDYKRVTSIMLSGMVVDTLFNSAGLPAEDFAKKFVESYNIKLMEPFVEQNGETFISGWRFISQEGYKLTLTDKKDIILEKIAEQSEMKFD